MQDHYRMERSIQRSTKGAIKHWRIPKLWARWRYSGMRPEAYSSGLPVLPSTQPRAAGVMLRQVGRLPPPRPQLRNERWWREVLQQELISRLRGTTSIKLDGGDGLIKVLLTPFRIRSQQERQRTGLLGTRPQLISTVTDPM